MKRFILSGLFVFFAGLYPTDGRTSASLSQGISTNFPFEHGYNTILSQEIRLASNGTSSLDTDNDGIPDSWELANGLDPYSDDAAADPDHDGLSNLQEYNLYPNATDPWETDTDHDRIGDGTELALGTDPMDPANAPQISVTTSMLRVTDVTPSAFSVVWVANQAASCFANVYTDPDGNSVIRGLNVTDESANHPPAGQNGVMKVRISGLASDTTYYFRIVTIGNDGVLVEPASVTLPSVQTERSSGVVDNDLLAHRVFQSDGTTAATGALLLATVQGASYPITGWVGAGVPAPWGLIDLNNIYGAASHMNLELSGGEAITLESIGGLMGFRRLSSNVPAETGFIQTLSPTPDNSQCTLDTAGPIIDANQLSPAPGAVVNNDTPLITASYSDQYSNIDLASVRLAVDGADVTNEAIVNSTGIEYTPTAPLSDGYHSVTFTLSDEWGYAANPMNWSFVVDVMAPTAMITYSGTIPANGDVVATLVPSEPITVTNNGGHLSYTFTRNGSFTFEFVDQGGTTGSATASVNWIMKLPVGLRIEKR